MTSAFKEMQWKHVSCAKDTDVSRLLVLSWGSEATQCSPYHKSVPTYFPLRPHLLSPIPLLSSPLLPGLLEIWGAKTPVLTVGTGPTRDPHLSPMEVFILANLPPFLTASFCLLHLPPRIILRPGSVCVCVYSRVAPK